MSEKFNLPDDVDVSKVIISSMDGSHAANIKGQMIALEVVVGLGHTIYGKILIGDSTGLFSSRRNAVIGEEFIEVEFKTKGAKNPRRYKFVVASMSEVGRTTQNDGVIMALSLVSIDHFINNGTFISKSYKGNISDIIQSILNSELKTDIPIGTFEQSQGSVQFAFTKNKPFEKIELLKRYAYRNEQTPFDFFTFFENFDGYHFRPLSRLFEEEKDKVAPLYKYTPLAYYRNEARDNIIQYVVPRVTDLQRKLFHGYFKTNIYSYDVFTKQFQTRTYTLPGVNNTRPLEENEQGTSSQLSRRLANLGGLDYFIPQDTSNPNSLIDSAISASPYTLQLEENMLMIQIYGNSMLDVPDLLNIEFPELGPTAGSKAREVDTNLSGKYIIQKITHKIETEGNRFTYYNDIALVRNSSKTPQQNYDVRYNSDQIAIKALQ